MVWEMKLDHTAGWEKGLDVTTMTRDRALPRYCVGRQNLIMLLCRKTKFNHNATMGDKAHCIAGTSDRAWLIWWGRRRSPTTLLGREIELNHTTKKGDRTWPHSYDWRQSSTVLLQREIELNALLRQDIELDHAIALGDRAQSHCFDMRWCSTMLLGRETELDWSRGVRDRALLCYYNWRKSLINLHWRNHCGPTFLLCDPFI